MDIVFMYKYEGYDVGLYHDRIGMLQALDGPYTMLNDVFVNTENKITILYAQSRHQSSEQQYTKNVIYSL